MIDRKLGRGQLETQVKYIVQAVNYMQAKNYVWDLYTLNQTDQ
jgi:hypothetical protein